MLIVDDEPLLLKSAERLFGARGFAVRTALDAEAALGASNSAEPLDLLVTDVFLPGTDGTRLAAAVCATHPGLAVLFISGLDAGPVGEGLPAGQKWGFLAKPFTSRELDACLLALLGPGVPSTGARRE